MKTFIIKKIITTNIVGDPSHEHVITIDGVRETLMDLTGGEGNTIFETVDEIIGALYDMYQVNDAIKEGDNFEYEGEIIAKTYSCHVVPANFVPPPVIHLSVVHDRIDELREGEFNPDNFAAITGHPGYVYDKYYKGYTEVDAVKYLDKLRAPTELHDYQQAVIDNLKGTSIGTYKAPEHKNLENELREAYFTLWQAVENGIDNDTFFKLRETFRGIQSLVEADDNPAVYPFPGSPEDLIKSIREHIESLTKADKNKLFTQIYNAKRVININDNQE